MLYFQGYGNGMQDAQLAKLTKVLERKDCGVWALNMGESPNISCTGWWKFCERLPHTKLGAMFLEPTHLPIGVKPEMIDALRSNRTRDQLHNLQQHPKNQHEVQSARSMWWNPINAKCNVEFFRCQEMAVEEKEKDAAAAAEAAAEALRQQAQEAAVKEAEAKARSRGGLTVPEQVGKALDSYFDDDASRRLIATWLLTTLPELRQHVLGMMTDQVKSAVKMQIQQALNEGDEEWMEAGHSSWKAPSRGPHSLMCFAGRAVATGMAERLQAQYGVTKFVVVRPQTLGFQSGATYTPGLHPTGKSKDWRYRLQGKKFHVAKPFHFQDIASTNSLQVSAQYLQVEDQCLMLLDQVGLQLRVVDVLSTRRTQKS